jgi:SM-20-related protein
VSDIIAGVSRAAGSTHARCPHLIFRDVLGASTVAGLLDYVVARQADFRPSVVRNRKSGERRVDIGRRDCLSLGDLGPFAAGIKTVMGKISDVALKELNLAEFAVEPRQFEICTYGDRGHFNAHIDTAETLDRVRVVSCVYYFAASPRRFSGGELRLFGFPKGLADGRPVPFVDIIPETDTLVAFPSWLSHEVLPVRVPTGIWVDRRFTINCWIHRVDS